MSWKQLLFMHWPVPAEVLRDRLPPGVSLDTFDGNAWIGVVPFNMNGIRRRGLPAIRGTSAFVELNVRTYVTVNGKPGVWFFSLDATHWLAVRFARAFFHLPYFDARMRCDLSPTGEVAYSSTRTHRGAPPATFAARYRPTGPIAPATAGSIEHFLTERYCLYAANRAGRLYRGDISHHPWPLQPAEADVETNTMLGQLSIDLPSRPPLLHYADRIDTVAWGLAPAET